MLRCAWLADTLTSVMQLLLGALLVAGIDLWFITRALQGYATTPPWLIVTIPIAATALWIIGAKVAQGMNIQQQCPGRQQNRQNQ